MLFGGGWKEVGGRRLGAPQTEFGRMLEGGRAVVEGKIELPLPKAFLDPGFFGHRFLGTGLLGRCLGREFLGRVFGTYSIGQGCLQGG